MSRLRVFVSWSLDEQSRQVAQALYAWLPLIFQMVEVFMSDQDIAAGERWQARLATELDTCQLAIVCVTRKNLERPWLHFEAGALSKNGASVVPYIVGDFNKDEIKALDHTPIAQFQRVRANELGTLKLAGMINEQLGEFRLGDSALRTTFEAWWPKLAEQLDGLDSSVSAFEIIDGLELRSSRIVSDLQALIDDPTPTNRKTIRYSGLLSPFSIDASDDNFSAENEEMRKAVDMGIRAKCIISLPTESDKAIRPADETKVRVENLIRFLDDNNPLAKRTFWTVSDIRQKNLYIIDGISCIEGYKERSEPGYRFSIRRTGRLSVYRESQVFDEFFLHLAGADRRTVRDKLRESLQRLKGA